MNVSGTILDNPTRILLFTGKGGVGKTSLACATAIRLAPSGRRVLLVSTDPASNLDEVLQTEIGASQLPVQVPGVPNLRALNIDPEAAARAYRERVVGPYRELLPEAAVASIEEQLSGACTVEIAAFDEFTKLVADTDTTASFNHVIFDTAPTGHTLRLLKLPAAWTGFIVYEYERDVMPGATGRPRDAKALYDASLSALTNPAVTTLVLVSRPDRASLVEADRSRAELAHMGVTNQILLLNGVFRAQDVGDPAARALEDRGRKALDSMPPELAKLTRAEIPLLSYAPLGVENLAAVFSGHSETRRRLVRSGADVLEFGVPLSELIDEIETTGRGVVMTMGKGGVGKTTVASAIAIELAHRGHPVHLSTTDPAAHVAATVGETIPNLSIDRIDPAAEVREYTAAVLAKSASSLDAQGIGIARRGPPIAVHRGDRGLQRVCSNGC